MKRKAVWLGLAALLSMGSLVACSQGGTKSTDSTGKEEKSVDLAPPSNGTDSQSGTNSTGVSGGKDSSSGSSSAGSGTDSGSSTKGAGGSGTNTGH